VLKTAVNCGRQAYSVKMMLDILALKIHAEYWTLSSNS